MKKIIIVMVLALLLIVGCGKKEVEPVQQECDYAGMLEQTNSLLSKKEACDTEKIECKEELADLKVRNNEITLQYLNNRTTNEEIYEYIADIKQLQQRLNECYDWNETSCNHTALQQCEDKLEDIQEAMG